MFPAVHAVLGQRAADTGRICGSGVTARCVEEVRGTLRGPRPERRTANVTWAMVVEGEEVAEIELGPSTSDRLGRRARAEAEALVYRGRAVRVTNQDGETFHDLQSGARGALLWGCVALTLAAASVGSVRHGRRRRRVLGGWWRSSRDVVDAGDAPVAVAMMTPASVVVLMLFGAPWWLAGGAVPAVVAVLLGLVAYDRWRPGRRRGRHARRPAT